MKVSLNWVRKFSDINLPVDELVEKIGAQLGAVESVEDLGKKYEGIIVARVLSSQKHPGADNLTVCLIDDGGAAKGVQRNDQGYVQIVCGALNIKDGMLAAWIPPGASVPSTFGKDPFTVEVKEIRGLVSHGMLASPKELALDDNHEGLLVVDKEARPGQSFAALYGLDDYVIDIENKMFTHRPDLFGMLGIAREIAGIQGKVFKSPPWYKKDVAPQRDDLEGATLRVEVRNDVPRLVPRFCALAMRDIEVKQSPVWLQSKLSRVGIKPVNNVVDITNFYMLETAQPLHAYDCDKLKNGVLGIRLSRAGEILKLIGGKELKLDDGAIVITDGQKPIGLGGVMGGADTEVDTSTRNIILESATFDMNACRQAAMRYGLFTEAATRFTKNQSPLQNPAVLTEAAAEVQKLAGGQVASDLIDNKIGLPDQAVIRTSAEFINSRLGLSLPVAGMKKLLENVEFETQIDKEQLSVAVPFWRTDIEIAEDLVEEVGRLNGYDHLPLSLPKRDLSPAGNNPLLTLKDKIRTTLARAGANEVLTYSFVRGDLLDRAGQDRRLSFKIANALSPELQYYRLSLTPSLLEKVHPNLKAGYRQFALFEMNKSHDKLRLENQQKIPKETDGLALVWTASDETKTKKDGAAFYEARAFLDFLARQLNLKFDYFPVVPAQESQTFKPYEPSRSALVNLSGSKVTIGIIGEFRSELVRGLKLPSRTAGFELELDKLLAEPSKTSHYQALSRYPVVSQEITLRTPAKISYGELWNFIESELGRSKPRHSRLVVEPLEIYSKATDSEYRHFSFRLSISSYERTLTAGEVNSLLDLLGEAAGAKFGAQRT